MTRRVTAASSSRDKVGFCTTRDPVAIRGERVMHPLPARSVDEPAVHEHNVACP